VGEGEEWKGGQEKRTKGRKEGEKEEKERRKPPIIFYNMYIQIWCINFDRNNKF
jgi:hypothetical protein